MPGNIDARHPSINDNQEVVWAQYDFGTGMMSIYSSKRGALTTAPIDLHVGGTLDQQRRRRGLGADGSSGQTSRRSMNWSMERQRRSGSRPTGPPLLPVHQQYRRDGLGAGTRPDEHNGQIHLLQHPGPDRPLPAGSNGEPSVNACGDVTFTNYARG